MKTNYTVDGGPGALQHTSSEVKDIESREKAELIAKAALDRKAEALRVLYVGGLTSLADYFVICSGNTDRQVKAIADAIDDAMRKERQHPHHVEGMPLCNWVLMDYSDVVVHVFTSETREYYNLDRLWADAPELDL